MPLAEVTCCRAGVKAGSVSSNGIVTARLSRMCEPAPAQTTSTEPTGNDPGTRTCPTVGSDTTPCHTGTRTVHVRSALTAAAAATTCR
jgi:hypothetical protein